MPDDELLEQALRFVSHPLPAIRRAALAVSIGAGGEQARDALVAALADADDAIQVAALNGLRRLGGVGRAVVDLVVPIVDDEGAGDELRAAAAALLGDADETAAAAAHAALCRALEPVKASFTSRLLGTAKGDGSIPLLRSAARAALKLGRPGARAAVERRLRASKGDARDALQQVLGELG
ncbi:MAG: hypothetical protein JRI23_12970 [Deltaproteobacteria bacterium]|nr:hypothetical protein [Deltaproteobacteria bacterium]MBW2532630.1 hypothetical protein [Deltaproteobacteria bacterium]